MARRGAALAVCLVLFFAGVTQRVRAQSDSGEIDIVVVDAATKQPLELARVLLDGPVITSELTSKNGKVTFTDVPDGIYRARIVRRGYTSLTSASFEVLDGRVVTVSFALGRRYGRSQSHRRGDRQSLGDDLGDEHRSELAAAAALDRFGRRAQ